EVEVRKNLRLDQRCDLGRAVGELHVALDRGDDVVRNPSDEDVRGRLVRDSGREGERGKRDDSCRGAGDGVHACAPGVCSALYRIHPSSGSRIRLPGSRSRPKKRRSRITATRLELHPEELLETANRRFMFLLRAKSTICPLVTLAIPWGRCYDTVR